MDQLTTKSLFSARLVVDAPRPRTQSLNLSALPAVESLVGDHGNAPRSDQRKHPPARIVKANASIPEKEYLDLFDATIAMAASEGLDPVKFCRAFASLRPSLCTA